MENENWYVQDTNGNLCGHGISKENAEIIARLCQDAEPAAGWEALEFGVDN